jgi:hypothetical protein
MIISLCTLLDIIMSLFKFVTNPAEPFQPWRIGCQAGDLYRDGFPLPLTEGEELSAYFQYLIIINSLIKVEEPVIEPTVANDGIPETIVEPVIEAPVEEPKEEETVIEANNTVDDIVIVEEAPKKGKKG